MFREASAIRGFHAHVYFDESSADAAAHLCGEAGRRFALTVGRMHRKRVGPHPRWSCQLAFAPAQFGAVVPWLLLNRSGLTVFVHAETGDDLADHVDHALWMGEMLPLDLEALR